MDIIKLDNVTINQEENYSLQNINLKIEEHKTYGFLGSNSREKTSLISMISGFIRPDKGTFYYYDTSIEKISLDYYRAHYVGHIFENSILFNRYKVKTNLEIAAKLKGKYAKINILKEILKEVELEESILNTYVKDLDLMQKQKVTLAQALIKDVKLIIASEPTKKLSDKETKDFLRILLKVCKHKKITLIISTNSNYICKDLDHIYGVNKTKINFLK